MSTVRVVVADDHAVVRAGIANALSTLPNLEVVGEAAEGSALLASLEATHPDLLVADVTMPNCEPISTMLTIRARFPALKILIVSAYDDDVYVQGLFAAGVDGYQLKDQPLGDLRLAVQRVLAGERWICSPLIAKLVRAHEAGAAPLPLTPRQRDLLGYLQEGLDNQAIARRASLSVKTVENHLTRLYRQIGVQSRLEAVNYLLHHPDALGHAPRLAMPARGGDVAVPDAPGILIVDDNSNYRTQMRRMVSRIAPRTRIYEAENIQGALGLVADTHPRLVLVDVLLADESGIDCTRQIKAVAPETRVVLISAYPDHQFHRVGLAAGALAFLDKKDLNTAALREVLNDLVG